jgi:hypothetical protein
MLYFGLNTYSFSLRYSFKAECGKLPGVKKVLYKLGENDMRMPSEKRGEGVVVMELSEKCVWHIITSKIFVLIKGNFRSKLQYGARRRIHELFYSLKANF